MAEIRSESESLPKVSLVAGASENSATFVLNDEDHTIGNALRYALMRDSCTSFAGYSLPHPSERVVHMRLQTVNDSAEDVFKRALNTIIEVTQHVTDVFNATDPANAAAMEIEEVPVEVEEKKKSKKSKK